MDALGWNMLVLAQVAGQVLAIDHHGIGKTVGEALEGMRPTWAQRAVVSLTLDTARTWRQGTRHWNAESNRPG